ncbi:hypothetical protein DYBT9623_04411 [Dyadobacter sp. CECT 9623]|uniref:DUF3168 domain-containing protein n=1 Tax=Dyadobacter linearis TaxID=2823330 RepID=A0ABM8UWK0_9BACT|nr:hypothetical protein [Dyadobacter sp. CECT 9623]CAG5072871.1 hypothetical protein DYBT9623_04411 [Dyadobacter sp. CECT 9623]
MKTALDQDTEIFRLLNVPDITSVITGGIYKGRRPSDSELEDIVINTITTGEGTRQFGVSNVNIYVKDIQAMIGGKQQFLTNTARLATLTNLVKPFLEETDGDSFALWIESTRPVAEPEINQHFMNIRIEFQFINH